MNNSKTLPKRLSAGIAVLLTALFLLLAGKVASQEDTASAPRPAKKQKDNKPLKDVFECGYLINSQTAVIPTAKTLEFIIQHRFGVLNSGEFDLAGLYAPSNIRIGFNFAFNDRFQLGIGTTKNNKLQDLTWKFVLLKQTRSGSVPVSVTYFGDAAIDVRKDIFPEMTNRLSYFHQVMFARKFGKRISAQIAPSYTHFNIVDSLVKHGNMAVAVLGRVKVTDAISIILEYEQNLTAQDESAITVKPNVGFGIEATTSSHVFQVFVTTGQAIINQHNVLYNKNDFANMDFCIGFNMTRLWNY